jgi:CubicO group peptidase (beta-lactamase class C family)
MNAIYERNFYTVFFYDEKAKPMQVSNPEDVGMSSERLACITSVMEAYVKDNRLPGIMTLLQRRGKVVHFGKYGLMDIEAGKPMQEDAIFRIYSMTKPVISVAIMMLLEEGRFNLNEPVATFIPAFAKTKVCAEVGALGLRLVEQEQPITLHHLLTHTSGLSYGSFFDTPIDALYRQAELNTFPRPQSLDEFMKRLAEIPLRFQPGTRWFYSMATDVLGYVIQVASGMPLADFLKDRIFKPLGMVDTDFSVPANKVNRLAQIYTSDALHDPKPIAPDKVMFIGDVTKPTQFPSGGAGLVSTLADYFQFCKCLLQRGAYEGGRLISRKTLDWMTANHIPDSYLPLINGSDVMDHGFGLGFRITTDLGKARVLKSVGEFGWGGAAKTHFWIDPAEEFIGLFMTQHLPVDEYPVTARFRNLAYQAISD